MGVDTRVENDGTSCNVVHIMKQDLLAKKANLKISRHRTISHSNILNFGVVGGHSTKFHPHGHRDHHHPSEIESILMSSQ